MGSDEKIGQAIQALESGVPLSDETKHSIANTLKQFKKEATKIKTWIQSAEVLADIGIWEIDHQRNDCFWSDQIYHILGYNPAVQESSSKAYLRRIHPEDRQRVEQEYADSIEHHASFEATYRILLPSDQIKYVEAHAHHFYNDAGNPLSTIGTTQDITDQIRDKQQIEQSLEENRTLLREIHHRVKNNLAVVAGLLQLQWLQEDDPEVISTLKEGANRMRAVAGIHKQLYEAGDFTDVALCENITKLATDVINTMESKKEINLINHCDTVYLNMNQTLPCTLITNEVVTNSIKHAFEGREEGTIAIDLTISDDLVRLEISDDGIGLPDDFNSGSGSLGINLIETLTNQLDAVYTLSSSEKGTTFSMQFQKEDAKD